VEYFSDSMKNTADFWFNQKDFELAEKYYRRSMKLNPFNFYATFGYSYMAYLKNQKAETREYLKRTLELFPDLADANYLKSMIDYKEGRIFSSYYHASISYNKNKLSDKYRKWHQYLKRNIQTSIKGQEKR
jgi:tetratricopeptide (TPR) repeat protein